MTYILTVEYQVFPNNFNLQCTNTKHIRGTAVGPIPFKVKCLNEQQCRFIIIRCSCHYVFVLCCTATIMFSEVQEMAYLE